MRNGVWEGEALAGFYVHLPEKSFERRREDLAWRKTVQHSLLNSENHSLLLSALSTQIKSAISFQECG